jgi:LL-diaminopimelate aminotransferase
VGGLREACWPVKPPKATFYLWAKCPNGRDSMTVAARVLEEANVVVIPGAGFGPSGEGFVRFALTVPEDRTKEAVTRLQRMRW